MRRRWRSRKAVGAVYRISSFKWEDERSAVLRKGLSPLVTTLRTDLAAPVIAGMRLRAGAQFSLVMIRNTAIRHAIAAIAEDTWTPVRYPGAVRDPDTGEWIER